MHVHTGDIKDLKQGKKETNGVQKGQEFGISFKEAIPTSNDQKLVAEGNSSSSSDEKSASMMMAGNYGAGQPFDQFLVNDEIVALDLVPIERTLNDGL